MHVLRIELFTTRSLKTKRNVRSVTNPDTRGWLEMMTMEMRLKGKRRRKVVLLQKLYGYLPVLPSLKHIFGNKKDPKLMRWHTEGRNDVDDVLRHPADACQWRAFNTEFNNFTDD